MEMSVSDELCVWLGRRYAAFKQGQRASLPPQRASRTTSSRPRKNEASSSSQPQQLPPTQAPSGGGQSPASSYVTPTSATSAVGGGGLTGIAGAVAAFASSRLRSFSGAAATATSVSAASSSSTPARPPPPPLPADGQEQEQRVFSKSASSSQATALNQPASRVATAAGESSPVGVPPSRAAALVGTDSRSGSLDRLEEGETEGSSLVLLMEAMIATREELQASSACDAANEHCTQLNSTQIRSVQGARCFSGGISANPSFAETSPCPRGSSCWGE